MDQFINQNLEDREQTRAALTQKLEALEIRLRDSAAKVKETIRKSTDIPYQVKQRPWGMFGLSVVLGCAAGRLGTYRNTGFRRTADHSVAKLKKAAERGVSSLEQAFKSNGNADYAKIKGATIGAIGSIMAELARQAVPTLLTQLENYSQNKIDAANKKADAMARSVSE